MSPFRTGVTRQGTGNDPGQGVPAVKEGATVHDRDARFVGGTGEPQEATHD